MIDRKIFDALPPGPWQPCRSHEFYGGTYFEPEDDDERKHLESRPFVRLAAPGDEHNLCACLLHPRQDQGELVNPYRLGSAVCYGILGGLALLLGCCVYVLVNAPIFAWYLAP